jgi:predicted nuclease of predicted toxin-antitoxin system
VRFKLDENLGKTVAASFQSAGYDVQTVPSQGLSGATDHEVINYA